MQLSFKKAVTLVAFLVLLMPLLPGYAGETVKRDQPWAELVDSHRHNVDVDGLNMHYADLGKGEPVVMVHGIGDSTYSWHKNAQAVVDAGFRVILIDQPGFGRSAIPAVSWEYSIANQAEGVLRVVDGLGIKRFRLVGHSLGGGVSLYLAWKHPERLESVVVMSPPSQRPSCPFGLATDIIAGITGTRWFTARALHSAYFRSEKVTDVEIDEYTALLDRPGRLGRGVLGGVCRDYFGPAYDRMTESYREVKPKMLIVWGREDTWHPVHWAKTLQSLVPGSQLEIVSEAGHNVHQEQPEIVNSILQRFLLESSR